MQYSSSFISKACDWWLAGLSRPWAAIRANRAAKQTVLSYNADGEFYELSGQLLNRARLTGLANKTEICLLVPRELTMSRALNNQQKGISLATIAEQLLPFSATELVYVLDEDAQMVHVAVAEEMRGAQQALLSHGVNLCGLAFFAEDKSGQEHLCVTRELGSLLGDEISNERMGHAADKSKAIQARAFALALTPLILCLVASALISYWLSEQRQELSRLEKAYTELLGDESSKKAHSFLDIEELSSRLSLRRAEALSAQTLRWDLTSMARNIGESTEVSQLIISPSEIILDASAESGSELQAQLEESKLFASTEFISSISQSNNGESERFRLKLRRKSVNGQGGR